jgi:hypothetical protein
MVCRSDYRVLLLKRDDRVIGFSIVFLPQKESFGLLEYMAVGMNYRNQGKGGEIFRQSTQAGRPLPVLLEVDSNREESADRELRTRRLKFYRRLGCLRLAGLHYILPLPGSGRPPEMDLMVYSPETLHHIDKSELKRWLEVVYEDVYHCPSDDPRIDEMLARVPDPVPLE